MRQPLLILGLVIAGGSVAALPAEISADGILRHVKFLSADELRGRGNGTEGLERAADYVTEQFRSAGLEPGGRDGGWSQPFELIAGLTVGTENQLTFQSSAGRRVSLSLGETYFPLGAPANEDATRASTRLDGLPVVFAGYGLSAPAAGYDDYAGVDVSGKAVLIFSHEPQERDRNSRLNGSQPMAQTTIGGKAAAALNRGARVLIVVGDPSHPVDGADYAMFGRDPDAEDTAIPVLRARRAEMAPLLDAFGLDRLASEIDADLRPRSQALAGLTVDYVEHLAKNRRTVRNIVGVLPGSDRSKASEAVVVGAHYDHVGLGGRLSVSPERAEIHNGADDNASGTAAIIEMARAARQDRARFPRTLVFVAFAGEERGLLGSAFYALEPALPIARTIGMLNLDMVGRANGSVDISGLETSPSMEADLRAAQDAAGVRLTVKRQGPGAGRSDDSSFINRGVPAINFFTGFHADYHRPGDDWEKVDADGTARIAALALELAARLAARPERPEFITPPPGAATSRP